MGSNHVRVGTKFIGEDGLALTPQESAKAADHAVQVHWVEVDGVRMPGELLSVEWKGDSGLHSVVIEMSAATFETVDFRESASDG